jgi:hypothetical protein
LYIWDVDTESVLMKITLPDVVTMMAWNPYDPEEIMLIIGNSDVKSLKLASQELNLEQGVRVLGC